MTSIHRPDGAVGADALPVDVPAHVHPASTRRLLRAGVAAGPLFTLLVLVQLAAVPWYDITTQPLSVLSIGELGALQKVAFSGGGVGVLLTSVGMRRVLRRGPAGRWGAALVAVFGIGLIGAGVFDVDPGGGIPPGAPAEVPTEYSWHMYAHNLSSMLGFVALSLAAFVFVRRFMRASRPGWAVAGALTGAASLGLFFWPSVDGVSLRLAIASALMFAWVAAVSLHLLRTTAGRAPSGVTPQPSAR